MWSLFYRFCSMILEHESISLIAGVVCDMVGLALALYTVSLDILRGIYFVYTSEKFIFQFQLNSNSMGVAFKTAPVLLILFVVFFFLCLLGERLVTLSSSIKYDVYVLMLNCLIIIVSIFYYILWQNGLGTNCHGIIGHANHLLL